MRWLVLVAAFAIGCGGGGSGGGGGGGDGGSNGDAPGSGSDAPGPNDGPGGGGGDAAVTVGPLCDGVTCTNGTQDCCIGGMGNVCEPTGTCPSQGFACDGPEDCSGSVCCFGNGGQGGTSCKGSCATPACHGDGDCGGGTPKCCPKVFTPNYRVCQAQC